MESVQEENTQMETQTAESKPTVESTENTEMFLKEDYSEKSFAVYGNTREHKDTLKALGGKFNKYLKIDGERKVGWIFNKQKQENVVEFIMKANSGQTDYQLPISDTTGLPTVNPQKNQKYQFVKYKVYKPRDGQKVQLKVSGKTVDGEIVKIETHNDIVDTVYIDFDGQTSMAVISRGKWQIWGYNVSHSLFFTE